MSRNLDSKIALLVDDLRGLNTQESIKRVKTLITQELDFLSTEHSITENDLAFMQSTAARAFTQEDVNTFGIDPSYYRTWLLLDSFVKFLRREGLIKFTLTLMPRK